MLTVLITGASRGLGFEFVRQYATDGWNVIACCRQPGKADKLQALAEKYKDIHIETLDVSDQSSINALARKLEHTAIDVLINNAGILTSSDQPYSSENKDTSQAFGSIDADGWLKVLKANTISPVMVLQAFIPHLFRSKGRKVANISSKMGSIEKMGPGYIAYRTSKAALNAAMCNIAPDLQKKKVAWVNLHPGWVKTDMGGQDADITPETSITGMRKVIAGLTFEQSGQFFNYDGQNIPW